MKKKLARSLWSATAKKWKSTTLAKCNADDWLVVNVNKTTNLLQSMNCSVCTKFMDRISSGKSFQQQWCEDGSKRLQHSAALEHAESISYKKAFDLHLKSLGFVIQEQTEKEQLLLSSTGQQPIIPDIVKNKKVFKQTKKKSESAYFLAKNEAPLSLFRKLRSHK